MPPQRNRAAGGRMGFTGQSAAPALAADAASSAYSVRYRFWGI